MQTEQQSNDSPWSFDSGHLALDFANTVDWHASDNPEELLNSYADLVQWADDHSILNSNDRHYLTSEAEHHSRAAKATLEKAIRLREAIYRIFSAVANDREPEEMDLRQLKGVFGEAVSKARIISQTGEFTWTWDNQQPSLEMMLWPIAQAAMDLLFSDTLSRVGQCADDRGCGQLFIDTSRNRSRQWCSMEGCGNRAKAMRHYQRSKMAN